MKEMNNIGTDELKAWIDKEAITLVDVRSANAYNGWRLQGEPRGGHIRSARSLPARWAEYMDWIEVVRHKGIEPGQKIVVYGYTEKESRRIGKLFQRAGYPDVSLYLYFLEEWAVDPKLPMERLERYASLVHPEWVKAIVEGKVPEEHPGGRTVICHAHYQNRDAYLSGHIPGAIDMDTNHLESPETWNRRSPEELKSALESHGINVDTTVILYGKYMDPDNADAFPGSAAGQIGAIRCAFIMLYAGVKDVRILNGGFHAWKDAGYRISHEDVKKIPVNEFGTVIPARPELAVDVPEAKIMLQSADAELVCVRSYPEYIGEVSGYNYIEARGRIPGAVLPIAAAMPITWRTIAMWTIPPVNFMRQRRYGWIPVLVRTGTLHFTAGPAGAAVKPG